jgi:GxxExxY protein
MGRLHLRRRRSLANLTENAIATQIVDAAYRIHKELGPGLLEYVYEIVLAAELKKRGLQVLRQHPVPIAYEGLQFQIGFRADLVVQDLVLVEVKSVEMIAPVHQKQH